LIAQAIAKMKSYGIVVSGDVSSPVQIGRMTDARWKTFFDTMSSEGLYPKTLDYKKAYDLRFVKGFPHNMPAP
jgi:NitT/TauT family transport system substrate-binding protein